MADVPNTSPAFIQTVGIIGYPVALTSQTCTRENPGTTPVIAYDSTLGYAESNGGLIEEVDIQLTGTVVATVLMMFDRFLDETTPIWRKLGEVAIAAATVSSSVVLPSYRVPLKNLLSPVPSAGAATTNPPQQFQGYRLRSHDIQLGFALTLTVATPIIVRMHGGYY